LLSTSEKIRKFGFHDKLTGLHRHEKCR
jgi:hypothetical protein